MPPVVLMPGGTALAACSTVTALKQPQARQASVAPETTVGGGAASRTGTGGMPYCGAATC